MSVKRPVPLSENDISPAGLYSLYLDILILLYTVVPLPLYGTLILSVTYSVLFEFLLGLARNHRTQGDEPSTLALNILIHLCIHLLGIHIIITTQVPPFLSLGGPIKTSAFQDLC